MDNYIDLDFNLSENQDSVKTIEEYCEDIINARYYDLSKNLFWND